MKTTTLNLKKGLTTALGCLAIVCASWGPGYACRAQDAASLPPGVQDVLKLTRAGLSEDLILTQVKTSGATYSLTADQIIYLSNQGVSQNVIKALLPSGGSAQPVVPPPSLTAPAYSPGAAAPDYVPPAPAPAYAPAYAPVPANDPQVAPPAAPVSYDYFQAQLQPYGRWVNIFGVGPCWVPAEAGDPSWRPYFNSGHWVFTDQGWFWQSDYPWGEIAFHYGRWFRDVSYGWVWAPGYDWAPAWVSWRYAEGDGCCGWAPLPLEARFDARLGLCWRGGVAFDVDFGLPMDSFVFIGFGNFWVHDYRTVIIERERVRYLYARSVIHNGYHMDHGRFVSEGIGRDRMARLTHHDIRVAAAHELRATEEHRNIEKRTTEHPRLAESAQRHMAGATARPTTRNASPTFRNEAAPNRTAANIERTATRPSVNETRTTTPTTRQTEPVQATRETRSESVNSATRPAGNENAFRPSTYSSPRQGSTAYPANSPGRGATYGSGYTGGQRGSTTSGGGKQSGSSEKSNQGGK